MSTRIYPCPECEEEVPVPHGDQINPVTWAWNPHRTECPECGTRLELSEDADGELRGDSIRWTDLTKWVTV